MLFPRPNDSPTYCAECGRRLDVISAKVRRPNGGVKVVHVHCIDIETVNRLGAKTETNTTNAR